MRPLAWSHDALQKQLRRARALRLEDAMNVHATINSKASGLTRPNGNPFV
jgi:hypothetical protein